MYLKVRNILGQRELAQIDGILRGREEIYKLTHLRSVCRLVEQVQQVNIVAFALEM